MLGVRLNSYQVVLLVVGGFCWVLAIMLFAVLSAITDVEIYDVAGADSLSAWMYLLVTVGAVSLIGAVIIAGVHVGFDRDPIDR